MGLGVPTGPRGGTHRARGSNIPTPPYHLHLVTRAGSYLRTNVRFLSQLYFRLLRVQMDGVEERTSSTFLFIVFSWYVNFDMIFSAQEEFP